MLGIVTDSASDLDSADTERLGIEVVPLSIRFGSQEFTDGVDLTIDDFYSKLSTSEDLPETAAPSPGAFVEAYERLKAKGATEIVVINLSSALSATMQSAITAVDLVEGVEVHVIDSQSITGGLGNMVLAAAESAAAGASAADVLANIEATRSRTRVFGALDTLENLKKGGRIGGAQAMLGTMLAVKPLLDLSSGEVVEAGKQRTRKKAMAWVRDLIIEAGDNAEQMTVLHGNAPDIDEFLDMIKDDVDLDKIRVSKIGPVIGTHGGPRVLGIAYLEGSA